jgi:DNA-binding IclR family transcriptional regulator
VASPSQLAGVPCCIMRDRCGRRNTVQSLGRGLAALELLAGAGVDMGVSELARAMDVHKSTASRLLATLQDHDLVERSPDSEKYHLGAGLARLARAAAADLDLADAAGPVMRDLAARTGETVNLAVLRDDRVVNVDQVSAPQQLVSVNWVGRDTPLHCTSNGKALLAFLPAAERRRILARPLERLTPHTVVRRAALERQLERVRRDGYAFTTEELEVGLNAVAAPVRDRAGGVVAAISVAGPAYRVSPDRLPPLGELTRDAGAAISRRMGFGPNGGVA